MQLKILVIDNTVNHSSKSISFCSIKCPLILKFYIVDIQAPYLLEIYHPVTFL